MSDGPVFGSPHSLTPLHCSPLRDFRSCPVLHCYPFSLRFHHPLVSSLTTASQPVSTLDAAHIVTHRAAAAHSSAISAAAHTLQLPCH
jgi:hypothetical protein